VATPVSLDDRLRHAMVLVELGELYDAELKVAEVLDTRPDDLEALDLFAKIKHMKGELSQAVACWAQIHAKKPANGAALLHLGSMLELARDPEKGAGEFLALGPFQLWKKPAAHLELEEAFRLFLSRRPAEAQQKCDRLAWKSAGKDAELHKLAILAKAWIAELSGDVASAVGTLEELGKERGYETDTDRILALARLYEQVGNPESLEKAIHICEHLERRLDGVSVLGRLSSLYAATGRTSEAERVEQRFLAAFRRKMYRPALQDVVEAASREWLPLPKLRALEAPPSRERTLSREGPVARRQRAISLALAGDAEGAAPLFREGGAPIDLRYLADLALERGDLAAAVELHLEALRGDPDSLRAVLWLLDHVDRSEVSARFREESAGSRASYLIEHALRPAPLRPSLWRAAATLHALQGRETDAARCAQRAVVLDEAARRKNHAVGRVLAAAVYHFLGKAKGLMHEVWATRRPAAGPRRGGQLVEVLGNLTPEMIQGVRNTFLSVREFAEAKLPHLAGGLFDFDYTYKVTKEDEPSGGLSAGLPTALAFLSAFLDRPVPQDVAATGTLVSDAHDVLVVRAVGEPEYKVRGAYNRNLRMLLVPAENRRDVAKTPLVPSVVASSLVRYVSSFDEAVTLVFGEEIWH